VRGRRLRNDTGASREGADRRNREHAPGGARTSPAGSGANARGALQKLR
jgi:hypothetical protein